jgi:histidinol-phosphate phosphatase family protein
LDLIRVGVHGGAPPPGAAALLCDRDGTLIAHCEGYVLEPGHVRLLPAAVLALRAAAERGFTVAILSNQSPVGRGLLTEADAVFLHRVVLDALSAEGVAVAGSFLCPHAPVHDCGCRKPRPGMVAEAVAAFGLDPAHTFYVGDAVEDMRAAVRGGVRPIMVRTGRGAAHEPVVLADPETSGVAVVDDVRAAVDLAWSLLRDERPTSGREALCAG